MRPMLRKFAYAASAFAFPLLIGLGAQVSGMANQNFGVLCFVGAGVAVFVPTFLFIEGWQSEYAAPNNRHLRRLKFWAGLRLGLFRVTFDVICATLLTAIYSLVVVSAYIYTAKPPEVEKPQIGWLQPANEPTPDNECSSLTNIRRTATILVGRTAIQALSMTQKVKVIQIGSCTPLSISMDDNGALIDASLFDEKFNSVGEIRNNRFTVNNHSLVIEKSGDLSTLVVHDENGYELLYVKYINENTFRVRGLFHCQFSTTKNLKITNNIPSGSNCIAGYSVGFKVP